MMELTLDNIRELAKLVVDLKLDCLKLGDLVLTKTKHESPKLDNKTNNDTALQEEIDDILFHSTSAPQLSLEQMAAMTVTPLKKNKASNG